MNRGALKKQLTELVDDFGYGTVLKTLGAIGRTKSGADKTRQSVAKAPAERVAHKKPDAIAIVTSLNLADAEKRDFLLRLAREYEAKQFMPNVTHVRGFLMHGHKDPSCIKSRQQVTSKVFKQLAEMSLPELRELEFSGLYGPPKRLGTYAEAIASFGRAHRQSQ